MADLRKLLAEATPGPWRIVPDQEGEPAQCITAGGFDMATAWGEYLRAEADARLIALAPQLAEALIEVRERLSRLSRWLDTDAEILADLSDAVFADHHHICGEIAATLASIDAIMESRDDG